MNKGLFVVLLVVGAAVSREIRSCNSCGPECMNTCGTRNFKTCCLNYVKKRSMTLPLTMDPSLRLELWLARSRNPYYQRNYDEIALSQERAQQGELAS